MVKIKKRTTILILVLIVYVVLAQIRIIGDITIADLAFCIMSLGLAAMYIYLRPMAIMTAIAGCLILLQVFSGIYNHVALDLTARGVGRTFIIFSYASAFVMVPRISGGVISKQGIMFGVILSLLLRRLVGEIEILSDGLSFTDWRHGVGEPISLLILWFASRSRSIVKNLVGSIFVCAINIYYNFRTMLIAAIAASIYTVGHRLKHAVTSKQYIFVSIVGLVALLIGVLAVRQVTHTDRAEQSDEVRMAMVSAIVLDMTDFKILGNGPYSFRDTFVPPDTGNSRLDDKLSEGLDIHGYMFTYGYGVGVLGYAIWGTILILVLLRLPKWKYFENAFEYALVCYFVEGCFLLALAGFDKCVVAYVLAWLVSGHTYQRTVGKYLV